MTDYIYEDEVISQFLSYISVQSCTLASCTRKKDGQATLQIFLDLTVNPSQITLHIFATAKLITFFLSGCPLMCYTEMFFIPNTIYHSTFLKYIVANGNEGGAGTGLHHLIHILVASPIYIGGRQIQRLVIIVVKGAYLITQSALNAF